MNDTQSIGSPRTSWIIPRLGALLLIVGAACGDDPDSEGGARLELALENSVDAVILPAMTRFGTEARTLETRVEDFCVATTERLLAELQLKWFDLSKEWNQASMYNFGPLRDDLILPSMIFIESMRARGTDYTDTVRESIDEALGTDVPLGPEFFESLSFNEVGLLAMEVLLFEDTTDAHSTEIVDIVAEYQAQPRKCEYLSGMATLLADRAERVVEGWTTDFAETGEPFRDRFLAGELENGADPVPLLFAAVLDHLTYVKRRKLDGILDAQISGFFYPNQLAMLQALENLMNANADRQRLDFFDVMQERGFEADVDNLERDLQAAQAAAESEDRAQLSTAVGTLEADLRASIPPGLGVDLGINFADGD